MRECKIRAWDKIHKRFLYMRIGKGFPGVMYSGEAPYGDLSDWEQYICLKNANGVEIWEGDIVKQTDMSGEFSIGVIRHNECTSCFMLYVGNHAFFLDSTLCQQYEVIGNIHTNPELLNQT